MPSRNSVEACPRARACLVLLLCARAPCSLACALMRAERLKSVSSILSPKWILIGS